MEEADKILVQSLTSLGCELEAGVKMSQITPELFIECTAKLLNTINANSGSSETFPTKLPPNTGVKFRVCTKFATACQQLGYKNEIGYQTFLYLNENDVRRLLTFLVEKLQKDASASAANSSELGDGRGGRLDRSEGSKVRSLGHMIANQVKRSSNRLWIPPYLKLRGLRSIEDQQLIKEGCKFLTDLSTIKLDYPPNYASTKEKYSQDEQQYFEAFCQYVTQQVTAKNQSNRTLVSLIQANQVERLKELALLADDDFSSSNDKASRLKAKEAALEDFQNRIKNELKRVDNINNQLFDSPNSSCLTENDLADLEASLQAYNKNLFVKGSRFTHSEKLQFSKDANQESVALPSSSTEEKKQEEIDSLKEMLEKLGQDLDQVENAIKKLNKKMNKIEQETEEQTEANKQIQESISVKQKTVNLINDAPANIERLNDEINNHDSKMNKLKTQFEDAKGPLESERETIKQDLVNRKAHMQTKMDEIKQLRVDIDNLNSELTEKDELVKELNKDLEENAKTSDQNKSNRQFFTKRIMEIVANIDKQKKEIDKILIESKSNQKEINQLSGKLERIFNSTDELIFKDAKKDETYKKVYKLFVNVNDSYEQLIKVLEETSQVEREIHDLEDQVNTESQNKVVDNMKAVLKDLKQIKEENEQLISKIKSKG